MRTDRFGNVVVQISIQTGSSGYLTVSMGRDYYDVAPVSGTYRAPHRGWLSTFRRAGVPHVEREIAA